VRDFQGMKIPHPALRATFSRREKDTGLKAPCQLHAVVPRRADASRRGVCLNSAGDHDLVGQVLSRKRQHGIPRQANTDVGIQRREGTQPKGIRVVAPSGAQCGK
jgi:hypothetical protein